MKTLVTICRTGDSIRISKVTAHGEEVLEPDAEARALGVLLWSKLSKEEPEAGHPLLPWKGIEQRIDRLSAAIEHLAKVTEKHEHAMKEFQRNVPPAKPTPVQGQ